MPMNRNIVSYILTIGVIIATYVENGFQLFSVNLSKTKPFSDKQAIIFVGFLVLCVAIGLAYRFIRRHKDNMWVLLPVLFIYSCAHNPIPPPYKQPPDKPLKGGLKRLSKGDTDALLAELNLMVHDKIPKHYPTNPCEDALSHAYVNTYALMTINEIADQQMKYSFSQHFYRDILLMLDNLKKCKGTERMVYLFHTLTESITGIPLP